MSVQGTYMTALGGPSISAVEKCVKNHCPVDPSHCLVLLGFFAPSTFVQSTK